MRCKRKLDREEDRQIRSMSSVCVRDRSVCQDDLSDLGSEHRNAKIERTVAHEVSGLLNFKIAKITTVFSC